MFSFQLNEMPCEFVTNFDAKYPVILGGLLSSEDKMGFLQVSIMEIVPSIEFSASNAGLAVRVGCVCCEVSSLLREEVFLRVLRFSAILQNQHFIMPSLRD